MKTKIDHDVKVKVKRQSKGVRLHLRRLKQEARKESLPAPAKKKRIMDNSVIKKG